MTSLREVEKAANIRRAMRWEKENAARNEEAANRSLVAIIAKWKTVSPDRLTFSNIACHKAPADVHCVFVKQFNKFTNPCVFCGGMEDDIL